MTTDSSQGDPFRPLHIDGLDTFDAAVRVIETLEPGIIAGLHKLAELSRHSKEMGEEIGLLSDAGEKLDGILSRIRTVTSTILEDLALVPLRIEEKPVEVEQVVDQVAEESEEADAFSVREWLYRLTQTHPHLASKPHHIKYFVHAYYGEFKVDQTRFDSLVTLLNGVILDGYITRRGAFYKIDPETVATLLTTEETQPVDVTLEEPSESEGYAEPSPQEKVDTQDESEKNEDSLSRLELDVLSYALQNELIRIEQMRREVESISNLDQESYDKLKLSFAKLRDHIRDYLNTHDIHVEWEQTGKARGVKYSLKAELSERHKIHTLLVGWRPAPEKIQEKTEREDSPQPSPKRLAEVKISLHHRGEAVVYEREARQSPYDQRRVQVFSQALLGFVIKFFGDDQTPKRATDIALGIKEAMPDVSRTDARQAVLNLVEAGDLHKAGTDKGALLISPVPVEVIKVKRRNGNNGNGEEEKMTSETRSSIQRVIEVMIEKKHANQGVKQRDIAEALSLDDQGVKNLIKFMTSSGVFSREKRWERSRSPHSTKKETMVISFSTQALWNEYRRDPEAFLNTYFPVTD